MGTVAEVQGTKQPICARREMTPAWRMKVLRGRGLGEAELAQDTVTDDLPPMLGLQRREVRTHD
jgi:hypothetical protein